MMKSPCRRWAEDEFRFLDVGDRRRQARTVQVAAQAAQTPGGCITQVVKGSAAQEGAFRWVRNAAVTPEALVGAASRRTALRCAGQAVAIVAVDQSTVKLVDKQRTKGFGPVGRGSLHRRARGLQAMNAVALSPDGATLGLLGQAWWARSDKRSPAWDQDKRPVHERESSLWGNAMTQVLEGFASADVEARPWFQMDRAADAFHVLRFVQERGVWATIRSAYNRKLAGSKRGYLHDSFGREKPGGFTNLTLSKKRAERLNRSHRRPIQLAVTFAQRTLHITDAVTRKTFDMQVAVVRLRERRPPRGVERIEWFLLSTYPVSTLQDALRVAHGYTLRWRVEEFHRTWKTGACNIEASQLRSRANFQRWASLMAIVATRIERLKFLARNQPKEPALEHLSQPEIDAAIILSQTKKHRQGDTLTIAQAVHLIALAGGYTGNVKAGPPGSVTIRRGLERVVILAQGIEIGRKM